MPTIYWSGLEITGTVDHDPGVHTYSNGDPGYPPSTDVCDIDIEGVDDEDEFSMLLEENEKPAEWKALPKEAKEWILAKWEDEIAEKLAEAYFDR
jgi:hypothetical protein